VQEKYAYGNIIGSSPAMRNIYQMLESIKDSEATVLITGETGTGKELIANSIHYNSPRKDSPMVSINCGAIPRELMEREFFGHVKGAYTGATENKNGYFQEADGGTLFLDEIGEMDKDLQVKLLRVLERGEIMRVGDSALRKINVRLIVATNMDLHARIQQGQFRSDLFYRIHVLPIHIPPLRERTEDIPLLIEHFLNHYRAKLKKNIPFFAEKEMKLFMNYSYPGNVRELQHIIERFCLLGSNAGNLFEPQAKEVLPAVPDISREEVFSGKDPFKKVREQAEKNIIMQALKICNNDYRQAAKKLNISLSLLYSKIKNYGLRA
jgi:transcriptional regulator with PAS, ATPase and Fis domain